MIAGVPFPPYNDKVIALQEIIIFRLQVNALKGRVVSGQANSIHKLWKGMVLKFLLLSSPMRLTMY